MHFRARPSRTTQNVQPAAIAFAEFTADHPHLHLDTVQMKVGTVTIHLHGTHALEHLARWEEVLGNCARSSDSFPSSYDARLHYTECLTAVVAGITFEAVAFHDGPGAYDPHAMIWPAFTQTSIVSLAERDRVSVPSPRTIPTHRCALALGITAALAVTVVTAAAINQRVNPLRPVLASLTR
ncbi:hypothetical protein OG413_41295 [Streptomyces sp. NBC_01433]|uniref:hypothetical protein n=1 Tax=Streptomyces sp. NBC_01433 TaxID=2903864 RepID=UPI00224DF0A7|nr:hypothetical protein [Streptomyces sp. NBC_01433]MCX4681640.1 hypothetical protein [Streptomyces sp. NBC_01433]